MDKLRIEGGLVYLTEEQARITGLPNPISLDLLKDDPFVLQERLKAREAQLARRRTPDGSPFAAAFGDNNPHEAVTGDKVSEAFGIIEEREVALRGLAEQLAPYLIDVPVTGEHDG